MVFALTRSDIVIPNHQHLRCGVVPKLQDDFVGRDSNEQELISVLNFSNTSYQVISIVGLPGVGKSTLAKHIANRMQNYADVCYYDLDNFPDVTQVFDSILGDITLQDLREWAHNLSSSLLIVFDDCDSHINSQCQHFTETVEDIISYTKKMKFLITSQKEVLFKDCYSHNLETLAEKDAIKFLELKASSCLNGTEKKVIAELTGGIPLALSILSSLFNSARHKSISPQEVIEEMNKTKYDFTHLEKMQDVFNLSYRYLDDNQRKVGRYLAHFPGSFDKPATNEVVKYLNNNRNSADQIKRTAASELETRSLLEYDERLERYHFHGLIKKFFLLYSNSTEKQIFDSIFQQHFGLALCKGAEEFEKSVEPLSVLKADLHNFHYLLTRLENQPNISYNICLEHALSTGYLGSKLSPEQLMGPIEVVTNFLANELSINNETLATFVEYVHHLASITEKLKGKTQATLQYRKREQLMSSFAGSSEYLKFCNRLQYYESQLYHIDPKPCFKDKGSGEFICNEMTIYYVTDEAEIYFSDIKPGQDMCPHSFIYDKKYLSQYSRQQVATAQSSINSALTSALTSKNVNFLEMGKKHHFEENYELSVYWFEEALRVGRYTGTINEIEILLYLEKVYDLEDNESRLPEIANKLNEKFNFLKGQSLPFVHRHKKIYVQYIEYLFKMIPDCLRDYTDQDIAVFDQYVDLSDLVFRSILKIEGESQIDVKQSSLVAKGLYLRGDFSRAAKIASYALNHTSPDEILYSICSCIILSKSQYALGNYSGASLEFSKTVDVILSHDNPVDWIKQTLNKFLEECCGYLVHMENPNYVKKCTSHLQGSSWLHRGKKLERSQNLGKL